MNNKHRPKKEHAIHTNPPWFITAQALQNLRTNGSIAGETQ